MSKSWLDILQITVLSHGYINVKVLRPNHVKDNIKFTTMSRLILSHKSMKNSYFGDMLMSKTLSNSQLDLSHHSTSNSYF